ncbi:MAG: hypothetical protein Q4C71_01155 [Microbacteriaceae bacterium]|nr:hypothetical protein [Microbacteriaceae bacterium]
MNMNSYQQYFQRITRGWYDSMPRNAWREASLFWAPGGKAVYSSVTAIDHQGRPHSVTLPPDVHQALGELRKEMADPRRGAWLSVFAKLTPDGALDADYNWEHRVFWGEHPGAPWQPPAPGVAPVPSDADFAQDFAEFPRTAEFTPDWAKNLPKAENESAGYRPDTVQTDETNHDFREVENHRPNIFQTNETNQEVSEIAANRPSILQTNETNQDNSEGRDENQLQNDDADQNVPEYQHKSLPEHTGESEKESESMSENFGENADENVGENLNENTSENQDYKAYHSENATQPEGEKSTAQRMADSLNVPAVIPDSSKPLLEKWCWPSVFQQLNESMCNGILRSGEEFGTQLLGDAGHEAQAEAVADVHRNVVGATLSMMMRGPASVVVRLWREWATVSGAQEPEGLAEVDREEPGFDFVEHPAMVRVMDDFEPLISEATLATLSARFPQK